MHSALELRKRRPDGNAGNTALAEVPSSLPLLSRAQTSRIRALSRDKQARTAEGTFIIEGARAVRDLLTRHPTSVRELVLTPAYVERESHQDRRLREALSVPSYLCGEQAFARLSDVEAPQGLLAVAAQPTWQEDRVFSQPTVLGVFGESIRDPLNLGAIIRTSAALDVSALWLSSDSADPYNPKVVRASAATVLTVPIFTGVDVASLMEKGCEVYAAVAHGGRGVVGIREVPSIPGRLILAFGNEGQGLSEETLQRASRRFTIPLSPRVESLNVAATVAIAVYHFERLARQ
ncbi:MAG TPA: RNA methyltransferase [Nitrospira sp.]|nr:RNA methyltransferase [Nitrospira sp.]